MTRIAASTLLAVAALAATSQGFAPAAFGVAKSSTALNAEMSRADVRSFIKGLTTENFSETLSKIEPFLTKEAGASTYAKSMKRIARKAKEVGAEIPDGFAKDAAATSKRRAKQDAFIKAKEEERLATEAEAAEAAAAAEAEAAEAAAEASSEEEPAAEETMDEPEPAAA